jgi:hypothetical protein
MAAGEALKTWFDPVVRKLKREWHQDMTPERRCCTTTFTYLIF